MRVERKKKNSSDQAPLYIKYPEKITGNKIIVGKTSFNSETKIAKGILKIARIL
jgi:hypothetical protein